MKNRESAPGPVANQKVEKIRGNGARAEPSPFSAAVAPVAVSIKRGQDTPLARAAFIVVLFWGLGTAQPLLLPILIAGLLAFLMAPLHRLLVRRLRFPDALAVVVSALVFLSPLVVLGFLLAKQIQGVATDFPQLVAAGQAQATHLLSMPWLSRFQGSLDLNLNEVMQKASSSAGKGLGILAGGLAALANIGSQGLLIFIFAVMMLASRVHLRRAGERILAQNRNFRSSRVLDQVCDLVQRFLVARMVIVLVIGTLSAVALTLLDVRYSIFLGAMAGFMTLVPAVGFILALIPTLAVAALTGHAVLSVVGIAGALIGINCIDNYYLTPKMVGNRVNINALASFIGLFAGGLLWGVWGMFLSVPILGVLRIAFSAVPALEPWGELLSDSPDTASPQPRTELEKARPAA